MKGWREEYRASLKSMDTEEHIDLAFYRPIGFVWAKIAARLGVSPNAITIASIFLGVAGGVLFYYSDRGSTWRVCFCSCGPIRLTAQMASWRE